MPQFDGARVIQSLVVAATVGSGFNVGEGVQLATFDHISTNFPSAPILAQTVVLLGGLVWSLALQLSTCIKPWSVML